MVRSRLPALFLATLPVFAAEASAAPPRKKQQPPPPPAEPSPHELDGRFPIWPTEVDRIAAPLRDPATATEGVRMAALQELQQFATVVILPEIELALTDPSPEVRRIALELCANRRVLACVPEAERLWQEGEASVRMVALTLLSQDPSDEHLELLYEAMRDANDMVREQAINLLVEAPLDEAQAKAARQEIVGQLGDVSTRVRATAARGLGKLGPGEGALALVRLLDDIDPFVAEAAAVGLGQLEDPRTGPALERSLDSPPNPQFANAAIGALARLPGEAMDTTLLELFDAPPRNTRRTDIANALGGRPSPSALLVEGLIDRIRDPELRDSAIQALLRMGDLALDSLKAARARGLEPDIASEVERLIAARELEPTPVEVLTGTLVHEPDEVLPELGDREAWFELMADADRIDAAASLVEAPPSWFAGALAGQLDRASTAEQVHTWLTALALSREPLLDDPDDAVQWTRIASWAADAGNSSESRCIATLALGSAAGGSHAELIRAELADRIGDASPDVRGCAALALVRFGDDPVFEGLLADPSPRVRAMAALALRGIKRLEPRVRARLALQADRDYEVACRGAAALTLNEPDPEGRYVLVRSRISNLASDPDASVEWQGFELEGRRVEVPMFGSGARIWAIVPMRGAAVAEVLSTPVVIRPVYPNNYYNHYHY
ncbi:HEAT repeat domain-containing protein [Nannocystaceae bacterium ST9]